MTFSIFARADQIDLDDTQYGYIPTFWVTILMSTLFLITTAGHLGQAVYYKMWWLLPTVVLAGIGETIGWGGRAWSSKAPFADNPFMISIVTTIISPTPLIAAHFIIFGKLVAILGPRYSLLSPKWYTIIFCSSDIVALVIQSLGGAKAAGGDTPEDSKTGGNIMLAGIGFQLGAITLYVAFAADFFYRYFNDRAHSWRREAVPLQEPIRSAESSMELQSGHTTLRAVGRTPLTMRLKLMIGALAFSAVVLYIRSIYRTIELSDGWNGRIIQTEVYFNVLDGVMVVLAMYTLNFLHPGLLLHRYLGGALHK